MCWRRCGVGWWIALPMGVRSAGLVGFFDSVGFGMVEMRLIRSLLSESRSQVLIMKQLLIFSLFVVFWIKCDGDHVAETGSAFLGGIVNESD